MLRLKFFDGLLRYSAATPPSRNRALRDPQLTCESFVTLYPKMFFEAEYDDGNIYPLR